MSEHAQAGAGRLDWPLMRNNITREDLDALRAFLDAGADVILTQSRNVSSFEDEWSAWLGSKHSVFVNSGSSANLISMAALRELKGGGEVIVPPLTWVSDIASVLQCGFTPVFADIDPRTLGMSDAAIIARITPQTRGVFLTHILGYNALTQRLLDALESRGIPLIEDVCESHGATFRGRKAGSFGWMSNFSFYYAHHMSTVEGGMVSTDDPECYEVLRMLRAHGMVREARSPQVRERYARGYPDLNPDFIFAFPAYNVRSTEINAVLGRAQLKRLDANNAIRRRNLDAFLKGLEGSAFRTDFDVEGSCNYAFTLILKEPDAALCERVMASLREWGVEFRRGTSGGGNQLRQPYLRRLLGDEAWAQCPRADHVHFYGMYIGNFPELPLPMIDELCRRLRAIAGT